ncbi:MAG: PAS domain S-box protein [Anaerolineaceae bacterium]|nr:PAS domain S-box protein [Anaerolineaceae bacterium]
MSRRLKTPSGNPQPNRTPEELYQALFERSDEGIFIASNQGRCIDVNQRGCEMSGYTREEILNLSMQDLLPAEGQTHGSPRWIDLRADKVLLREQYLRCKDGRLLPIEIHTHMLSDGSLLGIVRDVTERKQRDAELWEAHQLLETIFDHTHMMVACLDPQLNFIRVNRAYAQADNQEPDFFPGKNHFDLYPNAENEAIFRRVVATGEPYFAFAKPFEYEENLERGVSYWDWSLVPIKYPNGGVAGLIFTLLNVTDRLWAEQALRASEARFRSVYAQAPVGIELYDVAGRLIDANPACLDLFGVADLKSVLGFDLFNDPNLPEEIRAKLINNEPVQYEVSFDFDLVKKLNLYETAKSGKRCLDCRITPMFAQNDAINGRLIHVRDITEQKRADEERQAHLRFFENMDQINRAIQQASDPEQIMQDVLDVVLAIFGCDRAWLLYPCDPQAAYWHVPVERTRPEYPGAMTLGAEVPMTAEAAALMHTVLNNDGPVRFDPESEYPLAAEDAERFGYQSQISMALYPRAGKPWMFGLHQCSYARIWTPEDERLFQEVGRRLADAVTGLLAYRQLRSSEARFRALVDHATDAFFLLDDEELILDVNRQTCESLGYDRSELIGMTPSLFDLDATPTFMEQIHPRLNAGEVMAFDARFQRQDGAIFPVEVRIRPFWQDGRRFSVALARNITERKRVETEREQLLSQIQQQAQEVQFIIDTVPEGIFLLSSSNFVRLSNPIAEEFLALLAPEWEDGRLTHLGQRPLAELLTSPPKGLWHEVESNGRSFEVIARPVESSAHHHGWVFVLRDVTHERQIQRQVQAQEQLAAVGQLAAGIAHDFNNTLAVIQLYADILLRSVDLPARAQERLRVIDQQTRRAADLIQQILDFSRQSVMEKQPLDLYPFLKELSKLLKRTLPEDIQIMLHAAQDEYLIQADPSRIQQVMLNLAFNARDAMPQGGRLTIRLRVLQLASGAILPVSGMTPGKWVQVAVTDDGTGISSETLPHIFEPFFTTKEPGKGAGLGLAQVYGIVQRHEGFIDVATEPNRGTTFSLYFPAFSVEAYHVPQRLDGRTPQGQEQLILVVEDGLTIRQALAESLTLLNYRVIEASNGREALTLLDQHGDEIDLVLSDAVMPEMGGITLFHTMQERGLAIPFIMLTGHAMQGDVENLRASGLHGWLAKPPNLFKLAQMLQQILT